MKKKSSSKNGILSARSVRSFAQSGFTLVEVAIIMVALVATVAAIKPMSQQAAVTANANVQASALVGAPTGPAGRALADAMANMAATEKLGVAVTALQKVMARHNQSSAVLTFHDADAKSGQKRSGATRSAAAEVHDTGGGHGPGAHGR